MRENSWELGDSKLLLMQLLNYSKNHDIACILLSNNFPDEHGNYNLIAGFGAKESILNPLEMGMSDHLSLGFVSYDLKNSFEKLSSENNGSIKIPDFYFFVPEKLLEIDRSNKVIANTLDQFAPTPEIAAENPTIDIQWNCKTSQNDYFRNINSIRNQIEDGDFYELNYCIEWDALDATEFNPYGAFFKLNETAPAPFAAFFKFGDKFLISSSPERFLQRKENRLISQPIKGTRKRLANEKEDKEIALELHNSEKDRSENVMITDLVRNDLSKICKNGSVCVNELCKIYTYSHVHQMVSTIAGEMNPDTSFAQVLKATFPMGSMTGAPKYKVMQEIEKYENFKRGWYSGSVGWYRKGNFDLNVVIRSLQFDASVSKLIYNVGGAIVYDSLPDKEYEECLVKAAGILSAFKSKK